MFIYLLLAANLIAGLVFAYDKRCAKRQQRRIPEALLHILELSGGVFAVIFLMYSIRHKNRKFAYYAITYLILIGWIALLYFILPMLFSTK